MKSESNFCVEILYVMFCLTKRNLKITNKIQNHCFCVSFYLHSFPLSGNYNLKHANHYFIKLSGHAHTKNVLCIALNFL